MLEHLAVARLEKFKIDAFNLDVFYSIMCIVFNCFQLLSFVVFIIGFVKQFVVFLKGAI